MWTCGWTREESLSRVLDTSVFVTCVGLFPQFLWHSGCVSMRTLQCVSRGVFEFVSRYDIRYIPGCVSRYFLRSLLRCNFESVLR